MTNCGPYCSNARFFGSTQFAERSLFALDMKDLFIEEFFTVLFTALLVIELRFVSSHDVQFLVQQTSATLEHCICRSCIDVFFSYTSLIRPQCTVLNALTHNVTKPSIQ